MKKKNIIKLKKQARTELKRIVNQGEEKARTITRSRVLLLADKGKNDSQIMEALCIARNTVREVRARYVRNGIEAAIHEKDRPGAPKKFSGKEEAKITALACSMPPEGRSQWSLRLLADKAVELKLVNKISFKTIGLLLKKTNFSRT